MKFISQSSDKSAVSGTDGAVNSLADTLYDALLESIVARARECTFSLDFLALL